MPEREELLSRLQQAMDNGEFEMFFQPQFGAADGKPIGAESLIRWRHPERGLVPPVVFLAICESSGLIRPLGRWVLGEVCAYHHHLVEAGWPQLSVSVNISPAQLQDDGLIEYLGELVARFSMPASALELELSESTFMADTGRASALMGAARAFGVSVALDDFGTGYSSMATLHEVPADKIKIDRTIIHGVHRDENNAAICRSIISMAHGKQLKVIAEGVELNEEHAWLRANGCDGVQGYLFARPAPFDDMLKALGPLSS